MTLNHQYILMAFIALKLKKKKILHKSTLKKLKKQKQKTNEGIKIKFIVKPIF